MNPRQGLKFVCGVLCCLALLPAGMESGSAAEAGSAEPAFAQSAAETIRYSEYWSQVRSSAVPGKSFGLSAVQGAAVNGMKEEQVRDYEGNPEPALVSGESGWIEWKLAVEEEGLYEISLTFCAAEGRGLSMERQLLIDGALPFAEAGALRFSRIWKDGGEPRRDSRGNEFHAEQTEARLWRTAALNGADQGYSGNYRFLLTKGTHTLRLVSVAEPMVIEKITFSPASALPSYESMLEQWKARGCEEAAGSGPLRFEAEKALYKSEQTLYAVNDNSSPATLPASPKSVLLNSIGGANWRTPGQYLIWEIDVPESALYRLAFRVKQNSKEGGNSCRTLKIDGKIPFAEARELTFQYRQGWQTVQFSGNDPYLLFLEKGKHTLELQVCVGEIGTILSDTEEILSALNESYRKILMQTGYYPDADRDYDLENKLPECMEAFRLQLKNLRGLMKRLLRLGGSRGSDYAGLQRLEVQLSDFLMNPDTIPERMEDFRSKLSDCSAWVIQAADQPLLMDCLYLLPQNAELPAADAPWHLKLKHELLALFYSFTGDYNTVGDPAVQAEREVTLWMGSVGSNVSTGRDQAQIMKNLINRTFTGRKGIHVNVRLVDLSSLLPAVAAGMGPDVAINQARNIPVNYALRSAVMDLNRFPDLDAVLKRFDPCAYQSFQLNGKLYALPETLVYSMMFYRADILKELNLEVPQTWDQLINAASVMQMNYMDVGLYNLTDENPELFYTFLYQSGGSVYNERNTRTALDSDGAIRAFSKWTALYTDYKITQKMNALTRFRTGEAPLVIQPYTFYNSLAAAAPEIRGRWKMTLVPGTPDGRGGLARQNIADGTGCILFANTQDENASWEFLKWWTSADTQAGYGQDIEALQGEAGRWPTANNDAMNRLAWTNTALESLVRQKAFTAAIPEIPGGYMTPRYLMNAARLVVNNDLNARETLLNFNNKINKEIQLMLAEYGLSGEAEE